MRDYTSKLIKMLDRHALNHRGSFPKCVYMSPHTLAIIAAETSTLALTPDGVEVSPGLKVERDAAGYMLFEGVSVLANPFMPDGRFEVWS